MSDEFYGFDDPDFEIEDEDEFDCHGHFYPYGDPKGVFHCGAVGSEDCEFECPYNKWLGLTLEQTDELEFSDFSDHELPAQPENK